MAPKAIQGHAHACATPAPYCCETILNFSTRSHKMFTFFIK